MEDADNNPTSDTSGASDADERDVQEVLAEAQASVEEIREEVASADGETDEAIDRLSEAMAEGIELLGDVDLHVTIELGRTEMLVEDVLRLQGGSVVELDKLAGDPVDVHVNGRLVARGEVLVLNDNFCIRISEILVNLEEQAEAAAAEQAQEPVEAAG